MAPASAYLFLSIETMVNSISLLVMLPCIVTMLNTQGMHPNCNKNWRLVILHALYQRERTHNEAIGNSKLVLLVTSGSIQLSLLLVQTALFIHDFIIENLDHTADKEQVFTIIQNTLFIMSGNLSLSLVLERLFAVWRAAAYEKTGRHLIILMLTILICLGLAMFTVYLNIYLKRVVEAIVIIYVAETSTFLISIVIIYVARRKFSIIPYGMNRLTTKYQVKEVLDFSVAILPSVLVSAVMHTFSLVPTLLWFYGIHSLNCIATKLTLIICHKGMRQRFQLLFVDRLTGARIIRNFEEEGRDHFEQMKAQWDNARHKEGNNGQINRR